MVQLESLWNGKLRGLLGLAGFVVSRLFQLAIDWWYSFIVKRNLCVVGKSVTIQRWFKYRYPGNISLGNNVTIGHNVTFTSELPAGRIKIEDNVIIGRKCEIDFSGNILIGRGSLLSERVILQSHDHGRNPRSIPIGKELVIGENVWIGLNVIVLPNVKRIGENSVIAAGTVVTKEIPSRCIVAGVPGKIIRRDIPTV